MKDYFDAPERVELLRAEVAVWMGTPYFESCGRRARPGVAADCVSWIAAALQRVGAIGAVPWPARYVSQGGGPGMWEVMQDVIDRIERCRLVWRRATAADAGPAPALKPGDLLSYSAGRSMHHLALYLGDNRIGHCWEGVVREGSVADHADKFMRSIHRAYEPGT